MNTYLKKSHAVSNPLYFHLENILIEKNHNNILFSIITLSTIMLRVISSPLSYHILALEKHLVLLYPRTKYNIK